MPHMCEVCGTPVDAGEEESEVELLVVCDSCRQDMQDVEDE